MVPRSLTGLAILVMAGGLLAAPRVATADHAQSIRPASVPFEHSQLPLAPRRRASNESSGIGGDRPPGASVTVTLRGESASAESAVHAAGGTVVAAVSGAVTASVPSRALPKLAAADGITSVEPPTQAFAADQVQVTQGVAQTHADTWQKGELGGQGVTVAIIDVGFGGLSAAVSGGALPAGQTVARDYCAPSTPSSHGTAVAEVVHQMAPFAKLALYCVNDVVGFVSAVDDIERAGIKIVNSSISFPGDSRGDGIGSPVSAAAAVTSAKAAGILWVAAAGNLAEDHWGGTLTDANDDGLVDLSPSGETDAVYVHSGGGTAILQWDNWPTSDMPVSLHYWQFDPQTGQPSGDKTVHVMKSAPDSKPTISVQLPGQANRDVGYAIQVGVSGNEQLDNVHFDLTYWGDLGPNYLATLDPQAAARDSMTMPASSPNVLAVGAIDGSGSRVCVQSGVDNSPINVGGAFLEPYSSQGPTIDGRNKPDLVAPDGIASPASGTFCGTSAAAPHVAGAAALTLSVHPTWTLDQLRNYLLNSANTTQAVADETGRGPLALPAPAAGVLAASKYQPLPAPIRVLDTRTTLGGHHAKISPGSAVTIAVRSPKLASVRASATAVAVNLTALNPAGNTSLSLSSGVDTGTTNLALSQAEAQDSTWAVVPINANGTITLRATGAAVDAVIDLYGYFDPSGTQLYSTPPSVVRLLDTRTTVGGHRGALAQGSTVRIAVAGHNGVPAWATAVVNITAFAVPTGGGSLSAYSLTSSTSKPSVSVGRYTRANVAFVPLASDGAFRITSSAPSTHVTVDLIGWFGPTGRFYRPFTAPIRKIDTRIGEGSVGVMTSGETRLLSGAGALGVPTTATGLLAATTAITGTGGCLTAYPADGRAPGCLISFSPNRVVSNALLIPVARSGTAIGRYVLGNGPGSTSVVQDVFGYFTASSGAAAP